MSSSVHFDATQLSSKKKILPVGEGFLAKDLMTELLTPSVIYEINDEVNRFHRSIVHEARKTRSEAPFISKP